MENDVRWNAGVREAARRLASREPDPEVEGLLEREFQEAMARDPHPKLVLLPQPEPSPMAEGLADLVRDAVWLIGCSLVSLGVRMQDWSEDA